MLKTLALKEFLTLYGVEISQLYTPEMEVQVNVARDKGVHVKGEYLGKRWRGWQDPETGEMWKSFRIPWNADTAPEYKDSELKFDLVKHVEGIGLTGWCWVRKTSLWVGFDFDSIANHQQGLEDHELEAIRKSLLGIPWVTVIKSTSGKGLHVYVHFSEEIPTNTHSEHAALARSVLGLLSVKTGYSLETSVDTCGQVLWIYHRKQQGTDGFTKIKAGEKLDVKKIPANWREHVDVVSKRALKVTGNKTHSLEFQELYASLRHTKLDDEHRKVLKWFDTSAKMDFWWDVDHNMFVCHTIDLASCHKDLGLRGIFFTNSSGSTTQNCYAFPLPSGSWVVRRHSMGVSEHPSWVRDPSGWTRALFNDNPDFVTVARSNLGVENVKGEYVFQSVSVGLEALRQLDVVVAVPKNLEHRAMSILEKADKLIISIPREKSDSPLEGFLPNKKGDVWECVVHYRKKKKEVYSPDHLIRHAISSGIEAGWWINIKESWVQQSRQNVASVLMAQEGNNRTDLDALLSKSILNPWELVNIPFVCEYPGNRKWNKTSAQLAVAPVQGYHGTWLKVLEHAGKGLDNAVMNSEWCINNAITNGAEYLTVWIASMFQHPDVPLPYLFFVGPQNSGKSSLHEALALLMKSGYVRADHALTSPAGFNGEIANAVLCVVEETSLKGSGEASNRIKDWVTGKTITIRAMRRDAYDIANTTHWIQCSNDGSYCPILPGDTRIVVSYVDLPEKEIPKHTLFDNLMNERAAFLDYITKVELPESDSRLGVPCITSEDKKELETMNMTELEQFMVENTKPVLGKLISFAEFYTKFSAWLPAHRVQYWSQRKTALEFPKKKPYVKGRHGNGGQIFLGNITFDLDAKDSPHPYYLTHTNTLELKGAIND